MANTFHHGAKHDIKAPRNPEGYSGTSFVGCWMQEGRAFVKRQEHRMIRRYNRKVARQEVAAMTELSAAEVFDGRSRMSKLVAKRSMDALYDMMHGY